MEVKRMKKFRNIFMVLALALVLVFAAKGLGAYADGEGGESTPANEEGTTATSGSSISGTPTFNTNEAVLEVAVNGTDKLYYQVVKDENAIAKIKAANWIPAVKVGDVYKIDLSAYTKAVVVAFTFDATEEKAASAGKATVGIPDAKLKVKVNFESTVVVDPNALGYTASAESGCRLADIVAIEGGSDALTYQYRRSSGEAWKDDKDANKADLYATYSMLRASNGTLYVRAYTTETPGLATKEVKVKVPKGAAAPKIKIDYKKGVVKFPKSVEIVASVSGGDATKYYYAGATGLTQTKSEDKADVPVDKLVEGMTPVDGKVSFTVRTMATSKKYASFFATVEFAVPAAAPTGITAKVSDDGKKVVLTGLTANVSYEYEKTAGKWTAIKNNEIKGVTAGTELKIRIAPVTTKGSEAFGSAAATVTVAAATSGSGTSSGSGASSESGETTPTEAPADPEG
jgi:hypothetical protein